MLHGYKSVSVSPSARNSSRSERLGFSRRCGARRPRKRQERHVQLPPRAARRRTRPGPSAALRRWPALSWHPSYSTPAAPARDRTGRRSQDVRPARPGCRRSRYRPAPPAHHRDRTRRRATGRESRRPSRISISSPSTQRNGAQKPAFATCRRPDMGSSSAKSDVIAVLGPTSGTQQVVAQRHRLAGRLRAAGGGPECRAGGGHQVHGGEALVGHCGERDHQAAVGQQHEVVQVVGRCRHLLRAGGAPPLPIRPPSA